MKFHVLAHVLIFTVTFTITWPGPSRDRQLAGRPCSATSTWDCLGHHVMLVYMRKAGARTNVALFCAIDRPAYLMAYWFQLLKKVFTIVGGATSPPNARGLKERPLDGRCRESRFRARWYRSFCGNRDCITAGDVHTVHCGQLLPTGDSPTPHIWSTIYEKMWWNHLG